MGPCHLYGRALDLKRRGRDTPDKVLAKFCLGERWLG